MAARNRQRYGAVAMTFHWVIAVSILANIALGYLMNDKALFAEMQRFVLFQIHKSVGLTILVLSVLRLAWRLVNPPPPLSAHLQPWEKASAHFVHWAFYATMIVVPLLGWATVSVAPIGIPTLWFTLFEVPHLPGLGDLPRADKLAIVDPITASHVWLAYSMLGLFVLHVAGALKHQLIDRDGELARMVPGLTLKSPDQ